MASLEGVHFPPSSTGHQPSGRFPIRLWLFLPWAQFSGDTISTLPICAQMLSVPHRSGGEMGLGSQEWKPGRGLWEEGRWDSLPKEAPSVGEKQIRGHLGSHSVRPRGPGRNVPVLVAAGL